jgi:two-component system chemotaxis sensor kinase CheA
MSDEIKDIFLVESKELLEKLESDIVRLEEGFDQELFNNVFRYVHTLKGSSGVAGYDLVYEYAHQLENLMDLVRSKTIDISEDIIDILLESLDWFKIAIFGEGEEVSYLKSIMETLLGRIGETIQTGSVNAAPEPSAERQKEKAGAKDTVAKAVETAFKQSGIEEDYNYFLIKAFFDENIYASGLDPLMVIEDLSSHGEIIYRKVDNSKLPPFSNLDPEKCYLGWELVLKSLKSYKDIMDTFLFVQDDNVIEVHDVTDRFISESGEYYSEEIKIGEILVNRGIISEAELEEAIKKQDEGNKKLGDIVVEQGYADEGEMELALKEQEQLRRRKEVNTVRVDTGRLDNLMNLLGEIVIGQSMLRKMADELEEESSFRLKNALYGLDRITREFQEQIMSIRMIPIGPTFEQFRRFVRDAAKSAGKEINFIIEGKETELDKTVIEKIGDPLKHMIRNAIDHGVEPAEKREKDGKPRIGTLSLKAYHQEGSVYIEVTDDGRGINLQKIKEKAVDLGYLKPEEEVAENKLYSFLFQPGFSTAEKVGDLSGRGVGMDVVMTNVKNLRGSIDVESQEGAGTTVRIKLPLTLAIIEGMLVRTGKSIYIIPLLSILESIQPNEEHVKTVEEKGEVVQVRGEYISLIRLNKLFHIKGDFEEPWEALVVLVESSGEKVGLMVDELLGQQQIVIKSLDNEVTSSRAVSGAAVLGDGNVALILDIHGLVGDLVNKHLQKQAV